ncbi:hypothetical protein DMUE_5963, partial [Dictyocoela muelleri]
AVRQPVYSIKKSLDISESAIQSILNNLKKILPKCDFHENKLGDPGVLVQIDETMLNAKAKSHRRRSSLNRSDCICIVVVKTHITRAFAKIIKNKEQNTLIPIICNQVAANSIIWTDEHRSYQNLKNYGFEHSAVCHKYTFINYENGVNTQTIESFHNEMKLEIKRRKGIKTDKREEFLNEFCFYFNNRRDYFNSILNL